MTITSQTTRQGKVIYLLAPCDLGNAVERGERLRAYCPIHGGDHQRSLSIDSSTGWGFCHCCHATVLVETIDPMIADKRGNRYERRGAESDTRSPPTCVAHLPPSSLRPYSVRRVPPTTTIPHWQQDEVAALMAVAPLIRESLVSSDHAQEYLNERGISPAVALASGIGYLSRAVWE